MGEGAGGHFFHLSQHKLLEDDLFSLSYAPYKPGIPLLQKVEMW